MKISIKTLKGDLFQIEGEASDTIGTLKQKVAESKQDLVAERQKMIHAGKFLKDTQTVEEIGIKESDFIVCMVTKEAKKPAAAVSAPTASSSSSTAAASTPAPAPAPTQAPGAPVAATTDTTTTASTTTATPATPTPSTPAGAAPAEPSPVATTTAPPTESPFVTAEGVQALVGMGFPESESRTALGAAMGNPDLAYEYLLTGIPPEAAQRNRAALSGAGGTGGGGAGGGVGIETLRQHPQFDNLRRMVQANPAALPQVLSLIGQQNPALFAAIQANNDAFLAMMNEPVPAPGASAPTPTPAPAGAPAAAGGMGGMGGMGGFPGMPGMPGAAGAGGGNPMANPAAVFQMLGAMPAEQRAQFAQSMGMSPEQLQGMITMMQSMPPDQMQAMLGGMGGMMGGMGGGGGGGDGPGVIRLTEEEMGAVNRLVALGFSQQEAAQAYLACDKNEALAANLLFDGGFNDDDGGAGGGGGDDMYN